MRIAIDARYVADHFPGIGRYVYNLLIGLAELEHQHTLVALYDPRLPNTRHDIAALARYPSIELVATHARPFSLAEQIAIPRLLRHIRAGLYHAPYYVRPYAGLPCPTVVTLYDAIPRLFPREVSLRARLLFDLLTRLALRASRRAIAISASACAEIAELYGVPRQCIDITLLAADPRFSPQPVEAIAVLRERYGLPERYVLTLSSNKPHKNLLRLIEAWAIVARSAHSELPLVIAGHWDARYPQARETVERLGLRHRVRFLPRVAEQELPALYSSALLFVYPSLYEGFGLPPLEAMACGVPVVCGTGSSLPEVVGDAALGVDVREAAALADGVARLIDDSALRERLREAGLRRAASFSWRRTAAATMRTYERAQQEACR